MFFSKTAIVSFGLLATSQLVAGHAAIIGATGDQGGQGSAIGVDPNTPRDGTRRNPFQQDATRFKNAQADVCGETLGGGDNDVQAGTAQVMQLNGGTLPQVSAGGQIMMTLHQVNGDGAGPYKCMIDATGTGTQWTPIQVTQNVAGNARGRNNDQQMQDLPLAAAIPAGQQCTGTVAGQSNVCMVRCENPARAGPFGGCVPVQMANAAVAPAAAAPAGTAGTAPAANAAAPAVPAANANAGAVPAANAAAPAVPAANANAGAIPAANAGTVPVANAGAVPVANAAAPVGAATQKRHPKQLSPSGPILTDDDQEEEVFKRYVVTDN
ncbi:hypothetical protein B0J11DRAFT_478218 [Dendryphion nanum]|uniref:Uncharacterized protein n=1 Tax=Dendryphion nanum TaxID=256645 RepID=A0A9P9EBP3_9PLEO|nr:hypothetical protein B0J11DRAFT_478218 [Dendryphion nanum]